MKQMYHIIYKYRPSFSTIFDRLPTSFHWVIVAFVVSMGDCTRDKEGGVVEERVKKKRDARIHLSSQAIQIWEKREVLSQRNS